MIIFDDLTKENIRKHNPNWPPSPDHAWKILVIGGSGSRKANLLFNLINWQLDIDEIMLKIHTKKNINFLLKNLKTLEQVILMILKVLLNTQII